MLVEVRDERRQLMLQRWKKADPVMLFIWALYERVLSRMTPRLMSLGEGSTVVLPMVREKMFDLARLDFVPTKRTSVLLL